MRAALPSSPAAQDVECLLRAQGIADVGEVDDVDNLLGGHLTEQQPQGLVFAPGADVPEGADERAAGHLGDALFRPQPAQLGIMDQALGGPAKVVDEFVDVAAKQQLGVGVDRLGQDLVAAAAAEDEAVALVARISADDDVGGRVVRVDVDSVGAIKLEGRGEAYVLGVDGNDGRHSYLLSDQFNERRNSYMNLVNHIGTVIQIKCHGNKEAPASRPGLRFSRRCASAEAHCLRAAGGHRRPQKPGRSGRRSF